MIKTCPSGSTIPAKSIGWVTTVPSEHTIDDVLTEHYFWPNANLIRRPGQTILVMPEDLTWRVELQVMAISQEMKTVRTVVLHQWDFTAPAKQKRGRKVPSKSKVYTVNQNGGDKTWRVMNTIQNVEAKAGFLTKDEAEDWIARNADKD